MRAQISGHIDDLKVTGEDAVMKQLLDNLEERYDRLKVQKDSFEHVGIRHDRLPDGSYELHQNHYVAQLHPHLRGCDRGYRK